MQKDEQKVSKSMQSKMTAVKELSENLKEAKSAVWINYSGMNVGMQQQLKDKLREVGAQMVVVKNTLIKLAGKEAKLPEDALTDEVLSGQTAIIVSGEDPVAPLQVLGKFVKEFELPTIKVGVVEGSFQNAEGIVTLSKLPGKEVLLGQVVGGVAAPLYGIVGTLNANMQKLLFVLTQASKKGGE